MPPFAGDQAWSKALRIGRKRPVAQMPFAREEGRIAGRAQALGDGDFLERDVVLVGSGGELALRVIAPGDIIGHTRPGRILAGHQAGARRGADRAARMTFREPHAPGGQAVDVRRLVKRSGIIGADVHEAQIVGEKEDDVGLWPFRPAPSRTGAEREGQHESRVTNGLSS